MAPSLAHSTCRMLRTTCFRIRVDAGTRTVERPISTATLRRCLWIHPAHSFVREAGEAVAESTAYRVRQTNWRRYSKHWQRSRTVESAATRMYSAFRFSRGMFPAQTVVDTVSIVARFAVTPGENLDLDPGLTALDDANLFRCGGREVDNGPFTLILAIRPAIHDDNVDRTFVLKICHADQCAEAIS